MAEDRAARRRRERAERKGQWAKEQDEHDIERAWELSDDWKAYVTHVRTTVAPMAANSTIGMSIVPRKPEDVDVKFAVELGLMIMFDKPLILLCDPTTVLPEHLRRVADEIVWGDPSKDPSVRDDLMAAMERQGVGVKDGDGVDE